MRIVLLVLAMVLFGSVGTANAIVGGHDAPLKDSPWAVYLTDQDNNFFCGGTIMAAQKVLTSAFCAKYANPENIRVVVGREDRFEKEGGSVLTVKREWVHPDYAGDPARLMMWPC